MEPETMRAILSLCLLFPLWSQAADTRVVLLGSGTPAPDAGRVGAGIAVIHDGRAYLFDAGLGVVQRAIEANQRLKLEALEPTKICCVFFTHLHSDHIHDYSTLASTRWWEREAPLRSWGPAGLAELTGHMNAMLEVEAKLRISGTPREVFRLMDGYRAMPTEISEGVVFRKDDLTIEAFPVSHGQIRPAYGYKITTADRTMVISGDTGFSETIMEKAKGVDLLFHEVVSSTGLEPLPEFWQRYHGTSHTPAVDLARLAAAAKPKKLVLYHVLFAGRSEAELLSEIRAGYDGEVVLAADLDVF
jgi:ribonuclease BN (tRNA processing enzyme)